MLFNYIKTTFRAIRKVPVYGFINITGLALGIACAALIFLWVEDELGFDHPIVKRNVLYGVRMNIGYPSGKIESYTVIPGPMPAAMRGKTWMKNIVVYASPDTTVCESCKQSIVVKGANIYVMFRNHLYGNRIQVKRRVQNIEFHTE